METIEKRTTLINEINRYKSNKKRKYATFGYLAKDYANMAVEDILTQLEYIRDKVTYLKDLNDMIEEQNEKI